MVCLCVEQLGDVHVVLLDGERRSMWVVEHRTERPVLCVCACRGTKQQLDVVRVREGVPSDERDGECVIADELVDGRVAVGDDHRYVCCVVMEGRVSSCVVEHGRRCGSNVEADGTTAIVVVIVMCWLMYVCCGGTSRIVLRMSSHNFVVADERDDTSVLAVDARPLRANDLGEQHAE